MVRVVISEQVASACPLLRVAVISCMVVNSESNELLWREITDFEKVFGSTFRLEDINKRVNIQATRQAYKILGKDPNRYRPSAESLCRRILKNLSLYKINTLVDLINLVSLKTGYSIGGFDQAKIQGDLLLLEVGKAGELFRGIGRGILNIEGLPVYRDAVGGIGTPTSDEERTKIDLSTTRLLLIINGYAGTNGLEDAVAYAAELLKQYVAVSTIDVDYVDAQIH